MPRTLGVCLAYVLVFSTQALAQSPVELFETRVRPVLAENCFSCHGPKKQQAGLRLDSATALRKGSDNGPIVLPHEPEKSTLFKVLRYDGDIQMPPKGKLPQKAIDDIRLWIQNGAVWPEQPATKADSPRDPAKDHWAFQPVKKPRPPAISGEPLTNPVDRFVLAKLQEMGLKPAPPADRRTLLRRASFDLIGLPPTAEEIVAFESDTSPDAFSRVVDRLLASPQYGERWARHWLDVARYADTKGYVFTAERRFPFAYTYRDYVIRAFNEDLPFDRFVMQQLAADLMPSADRRALAAEGFLTVGRRFLNNINDIIDDRIDVVCRGFLGLTVTCARCHDHKFDPIPTKDYYSLYGVFASSPEATELPLIGNAAAVAQATEYEKELQKRQQRVEDFRKEMLVSLHTRFRNQVGDHLLATTRPEARGMRRGGNSNLTRGEPHPAVVRRWVGYLEQARAGQQAIFEPWFQLVKVPAAEFASKASSYMERANAAHTLNPLVLHALREKPIASLADLADRYGKLFQRIEKEWQAALQQKPAPSQLADPAMEALRQVLYAASNPTALEIQEIDRYFDRAAREKLAGLKRQVEQWEANSNAAPPRAMVVQEAPGPQPHVFLRGNPNNPGEQVPRQFLAVLAGKDRKPFQQGSGRLELARAIADTNNPLTARVLVNRIWLHLFGYGIVRTPSDFGLRGDPPTHPELLDYLAATFMENGWSIKSLHRQILLSRTYQQSSQDEPTNLAADPENRWLWKMNRRRLEFEALHDAMLAVSGKLDRQMGGRAVEMTKSPFATRRAIYGFIDRQNLPGLLRTFDFASPDSSTPQRHVTTVPQQALFLMNSSFLVEQAKHLLRRPEFTAQTNDVVRIQTLYRLILGRLAESEELAMATEFLHVSRSQEPDSLARSSAWEELAQVLFLTNEFAFVD